MRTLPSLRKIANRLAALSWDPSKPEELSHERVQAILNIIAEYSAYDASRLRRFYVRSLKRWYRCHCVEIEFCGPYEISFFERCRDKVQNGETRPLGYVARENPQLLAGFRLRYGDYLWSQSVKDSLEFFKTFV
ncbi:MAG: hypothetical protein LBG98_00370 [Puniceicoccales bacterium]|jgi:hypothetical protein|nr:hypothetical protein [Puniceicoccales bacterium]